MGLHALPGSLKRDHPSWWLVFSNNFRLHTSENIFDGIGIPDFLIKQLSEFYEAKSISLFLFGAEVEFTHHINISNQKFFTCYINLVICD